MSTTKEHPGKEQETSKLDLSVTQVVASSLAAVSAAVASSKLGVGGTLMGAAAASVVATVGSAVYSHSIATTRARLKAATTLRPSAHAPSAAPAPGSGPETLTVDYEDDREPGATAVLPREPGSSEAAEAVEAAEAGEGGLFSGLRWGRLVLAMVVVFALAFVYLTIAEIGLGRSVAAVLNGEERSGTTLSRVVNPQPAGSAGDQNDSEQTDPEESSSSDPSSDPSSESGSGSSEDPTSDSEPSSDPTESSTPSSDPGSDSSSDPGADSGASVAPTSAGPPEGNSAG